MATEQFDCMHKMRMKSGSPSHPWSSNISLTASPTHCFRIIPLEIIELRRVLVAMLLVVVPRT